jgi:phosphopantothenoylcysteine decarboxylase/phosphopantothenate--cysteine ligase
VAPATADIIARAALGLANDLLSTLLLANESPLLLAPAMNPKMFAHPAVRENLDKLRSRGALILGPEPGRTACGEVGPGRMSEPEVIADAAQALVTPHDLEGVKVLITAGPTREHLDPVRFISNPSSGRMGWEVARVAKRRGADVWLVLGPSHLPDPWGVHTIRVTSAEDMRQAVEANARDAEVVIKSAAVSDFRPATCAPQKVKKKGRSRETCELVCTTDILADLSRHAEGQILVGFAAETENIVENAREKLVKKHLDLLVANDVTDPESGFSVVTNRVRIITTDGRVERMPLLPKEEVAGRLLNRVSQILERKKKKG